MKSTTFPLSSNTPQSPMKRFPRQMCQPRIPSPLPAIVSAFPSFVLLKLWKSPLLTYLGEDYRSRADISDGERRKKFLLGSFRLRSIRGGEPEFVFIHEVSGLKSNPAVKRWSYCGLIRPPVREFQGLLADVKWKKGGLISWWVYSNSTWKDHGLYIYYAFEFTMKTFYSHLKIRNIFLTVLVRQKTEHNLCFYF